MTEVLSTLNIPLKWAAKEEREDEPLQTGFFLFHDEAGCVVVRKPAETRNRGLEARNLVTSSPTATDSVERSSAPAKNPRVPQTRVLRGCSDQRYILLKKYEGFVTSLYADSFSARLFENAWTGTRFLPGGSGVDEIQRIMVELKKRRTGWTTCSPSTSRSKMTPFSSCGTDFCTYRRCGSASPAGGPFHPRDLRTSSAVSGFNGTATCRSRRS